MTTPGNQFGFRGLFDNTEIYYKLAELTKVQ